MSRLIIFCLLFSVACANFRTLKYKEENKFEPGQSPLSKEKATLCILRPPRQIGGNYIIHDGEQKIGILSAASFFVIEVNPGVHTLSYSDAWKDSKEKFTIQLEKAKIYYIVLNQVQVGTYMAPRMVDTPVYAGQFSLVNEHEVKSLFPEMNEVDLDASSSIYR